MRARWSARRWDAARRGAVPSTRSARSARGPCRSARVRGTIGYPAKLGGSSSGRTTDSDSVYLGSNPSPPANKKGPSARTGPLSFHRPARPSPTAAGRRGARRQSARGDRRHVRTPVVQRGQQRAVDAGDGVGDRAAIALVPVALLLPAASLVPADEAGGAADAVVERGRAGHAVHVEITVGDVQLLRRIRGGQRRGAAEHAHQRCQGGGAQG